MSYLGLWVTCEGVKLLIKKVESIKNMTPQTIQKVMRKLKGIVN